MTDDKKADFFGAQAGQPVNASGENQVPAPQIPASPSITEEVVRRVVGEALDTFSRTQQSQRDRMEARIKTEVEDRIALLRNSGVNITDDLTRSIQQNVAQKVIADSQQEGSKQAPAPEQGQGSTQAPDPFAHAFSVADDWMKETGVIIEESDPEAKSLDFTSPSKFLRTFQAALEAKRQRSNAAVQQRASANTAGVGGGGGTSPDLMAAYQKEVALVRGNIREVTRIQKKYREQGLNI